VVQSFREGPAAGGDQRPARRQPTAIGGPHLEPRRTRRNFRRRDADDDFDPAAPRGPQQRGDRVARPVGTWKYPAIRLDLQGDAAGLEPGYRFGRAEAVQRTQHFRRAARVVAREFAQIARRMRQVAAPASGPGDLFQRRRAFFQHPRAQCRGELRYGRRRENPGGASAGDDDIGALHAVILGRTSGPREANAVATESALAR